MQPQIPHEKDLSVTIFDLSHIITPDMPVYPGTPGPEISRTSTILSDGFAEKKIILHSHHGTHIDAPAHILADEAHLDELPIGHFVGEAYCFAVSSEIIDKERIEAADEVLQAIDFLLFVTGWSKFWGDGRYFSGYPVLS